MCFARKIIRPVFLRETSADHYVELTVTLVLRELTREGIV